MHAKGRKGFRGLGRWKDGKIGLGDGWGFNSVLGDQKQNHEELWEDVRDFLFLNHRIMDYGVKESEFEQTYIGELTNDIFSDTMGF